MELPFAVDSPDRSNSNNHHHHHHGDTATNHNTNNNLHSSNVSSLETASSQGSLFMSSSVNPTNNNHANNNNNDGYASTSGQQVQPKTDITEQIDFTYVTVGEVDSDEVDVVIGGELRPHTIGAGGNGQASENGYYYGDPTTALEDTNNNSTKMPQGNMLSVLLRSETSTLMTMGMGMPPETDLNNESSSSLYIHQCEAANNAAQQALHSKEQGNLEAALQAHSEAAKLFLQASESVRQDTSSSISINATSHNHNVVTAKSSMALQKSLLMSSQSQARAALALKRVIKRPFDVTVANHEENKNSSSSPTNKTTTSTTGQQQRQQQGGTSISNNDANRKHSQGNHPTNKDNHNDRIRATVRGALWKRNEEDLSESQFLGRATSTTRTRTANNNNKSPQRQQQSPSITTRSDSTDTTNQKTGTTTTTPNTYINPVDEMMELEKELRNMDMALELGSSIASLATSHHHHPRPNNTKSHQLEDGSFCVVPTSSWAPGSSGIGGGGPNLPSHQQQHQNIRARANRVQPSTTHPSHRTLLQQQQQQQQHASAPFPPSPPTTNGLESSWWGHTSTIAASQILSSSILSSATIEPLHSHPHAHSGTTLDGGHSSHHPHGGQQQQQQQQQVTNNKQVMNLLDSLRTLSEENATLLRELESAEAARAEAKAAKETMRRFKAQYEQRFAELRKALEKFKGGNNPGGNGTVNPVTDSQYVRTASQSREAQEKENLIRRLTMDLKKEKEDSSKKDAALRKYESFYREVKARSAQKAAQKQREIAASKKRQNSATPRLPPR